LESESAQDDHDLQAAPRLLLTDRQSPAAPAYFDPELVGGTIHAEAFAVHEGEAPHEEKTPAHPPAAMQPPSGAIPIDARNTEDEVQLRELIDRELSGHTEADRDVWVDVLKDLSLKEAAEILKIWKVTGGPTRLPDRPLKTPGHMAPLHLGPDADLASAELLERLAVARRVVQHNLTQSDHAGFVRGDPQATAAAAVDSADGQTPDILDLAPGEVVESGNPLHLAIIGHGFFVLRKGEEIACTRCGRFDLSDSGRLIQRRADGEWELDPGFEVPEDAARLVVSQDGSVQVHRSGKGAVDCGRLQLAVFINPQHLKRGGADLLRPSTASGPMHRVNPGGEVAGRIRQGALELSNATIEREQAALEQMERRLELLRDAGTTGR
jgi:flagellar basal body rod protein FlgG